MLRLEFTIRGPLQTHQETISKDGYREGIDVKDSLCIDSLQFVACYGMHKTGYYSNSVSS